MKRIKYEYDGLIGISRQIFRINGIETKVYLDTENFKFEIVDIEGELISSGGKTKKGNLEVLKRQAKRALEELGVEFEDEKRKPRKGKVDESKT